MHHCGLKQGVLILQESSEDMSVYMHSQCGVILSVFIRRKQQTFHPVYFYVALPVFFSWPINIWQQHESQPP